MIMPSRILRILIPTGADATILWLNCSCSSRREALFSAGENIFLSKIQTKIKIIMAEIIFKISALKIVNLNSFKICLSGNEYTTLKDEGNNLRLATKSLKSSSKPK